MPDYTKLKAEYIRGGISLRDLAEKHGVSSSTLLKVARREKWTDLKNQKGIKMDAKLVESVASKEARDIELINQATDKLLAVTLAMMESTEVMSNPSNARQVALTLKDIRELKGVKTDLDRQEQMARIEKLRREAQQEEKQDREIKVVIANEVGEYCE